MNLADIRKKSEEKRRYVQEESEKNILSPVEACAELLQPDFYGEDLQCDAVDDYQDPFDYGDHGQLDDSLLPKVEDFDFGAAVEEIPEAEDVTPESGCQFEAELQPQPMPQLEPCLTPEPSLVRSSGYNPLETILAGRELAQGDDELSSYDSAAAVTAELQEYLCFRVGDEFYAISIMAIKEIIRPRDVTEVPRMPSFICGVISLRGVIIPVMDMRQRLSLHNSGSTGRERVIVLRLESGFCGILVDEVIQVARLGSADIEEPPAVLDGIDREFVRALGHFEGKLLIILNLETILDIAVH